MKGEHTDKYAELRDWTESSEDWCDGNRLNHGKVARYVGEIGLAALKADNALHNQPESWPVDMSWDELAESSKWGCVRAGLAALAETQTELDRSREALNEMQGVMERLPKFIDTGKPICEGDEVHEIMDTRREGPVLGLGRARMIIDDDWDDYAIEGYSTSQAAEAALAARKGE